VPRLSQSRNEQARHLPVARWDRMIRRFERGIEGNVHVAL